MDFAGFLLKLNSERHTETQVQGLVENLNKVWSRRVSLSVGR